MYYSKVVDVGVTNCRSLILGQYLLYNNATCGYYWISKVLILGNVYWKVCVSNDRYFLQSLMPISHVIYTTIDASITQIEP